MTTFFPTDSATRRLLHVYAQPYWHRALEDGFYWHRIRRMAKKG